MKFFSLLILVGSLPVVLWLWSGGLGTSQSVAKNTVNETIATTNVDSKIQDQNNNRELDLTEASAATLRKIGEIDKKIESAKQDLIKNESARQAVIKDLIKIQAKIDSVIKSESNF